MFTKNSHKRLVLFTVFLVGIMVIVVFPIQASASQILSQDPLNNSSCYSCHEDLYYLHDTGKAYCLTVHKDHCVNCHSGNPKVMDKDHSHLELIAYPQKDDGAKCQECHTQDAQTRLATFASMGGYKEVVEAIPYTPDNIVEVGFPELHEATPAVEKLPFILGAFVLFGLWLTLVLWSQQS